MFKAEELGCAGRSYHKKCATCASCAKKLDHHTVCNGADSDIYCKSCYGRRFAPAGKLKMPLIKKNVNLI